MQGTGNPIADFMSSVSSLFGSENLEPSQPTLSKRSPSEMGFQMVPAGTTDDLPSFQLPESLQTESAETSTETEKLAEWFSQPKNMVKAQAVSSGVQLAGSLMNIRQAESDAMEQMAAQYGLAQEVFERNENLRSTARAVASVRQLEQVVNAINKQGQVGGVQRQQFIRNPLTGGLV